ncbi:hypothetical protein HWV62_34103 [Athelia sp. TMB]|nr:hypothetical protein HWV62_34103 [Athelia sp. TMB]
MSDRKTVLITGCSAGGIGDALAQEFHRRARRTEAMSALTAQGIHTLELDVTDHDSVASVREEVIRLCDGKLDILINNAGQGMSAPATDFDVDEARALFEVNVFGPMQVVKIFIDPIIASGRGRIVQIGSIAGVVPLPFGSVYNASKGALHSWSNTLRVELAPLGFVITGGVNTNISRPSSIAPTSLYYSMDHLYQANRVGMTKRGMDPRLYAKTVVDEALCKSPRKWIWEGQFSWVMWFCDAFLGRGFIDWFLSKRFGLSEFASLLRGRSRKVKSL